MIVTLDTNVLLQSLGRTSSMRPIWDAFLLKRFTLILTTVILLEYEEIIAAKTSARVAENVISLLLSASNTYIISIYYYWNLVKADIDDNKFSDAAIAGNADYLVSNDAHFNELKTIEFPSIKVVNAEAFKLILDGKQ